MTFEEWRAAAERNAGGPLSDRDAREQYDMHILRTQGGSPSGTAEDYDLIQGGRRKGFGSREGATDTTGMRDYARRHGFSEDFERFDDATLQVWERYKDDRCPPHSPYAAKDGTGCVEKPIDTNFNSKNAEYLGVQPAQRRGDGRGGAGRGAAAPAAPAQPTTFGSQLSFTGNPTVDMLIQQFNTRTNLQGTQRNIFGLGEDRRPGGEGASADDAETKGQLLAGGGLWWGQEGFNRGFDASKERQQPQQKRSGGRRSRGGGAAPTPQEIAAPPPPAAAPAAQPQSPRVPAYKDMVYGGGPMRDMLDRRFGRKLEI
jgi:hypothetical protein